jgi:Tfp pilus assembly protein FimV
MTHAAAPLRRPATWLALACALAASASPVWSADTAAALALKALLGPQAAFQQQGGLPPTAAHSAGVAATGSASAGVAAAPASTVGTTVTVQRGETLDRLIRRALPDVPLHPDFLRKAFVSLNPQVFPSGSPNLMRAGATMQVPSMAALRQMMLSQHPASAALLNSTDGPNAEGSAHPHDPKDQRRWVRFP